MDNKEIADGIEKYLYDTPYSRWRYISKMLNADLKEEYKDFPPQELKTCVIDIDSIKPSPVDSELYEFSAKGKFIFEDRASKISISPELKFHGFAHLVTNDERDYVDMIEIDSMPPLSVVLESVIK